MRLLVLGAGVSGAAAARLALRMGHRVVVYDRRPAVVVGLVAEGIATASGAWHRDLLVGAEAVVTSPGFGESSPPVVDTLEWGLPLWSEVEFAYRHLDVPVVAVTGTNGKTTVTELIADMLTRSGIDAPALGNIGTPLSSAVGMEMDVAVVEVSSFQLRFVDTFRPRVAVITNVAADHLDWHGSVEAYRMAKARIFENQAASDDLVYDAGDPGASALAAGAPSRRWPVAVPAPPGGWGVDGGVLRFPSGLIDVSKLKVEDRSFLVDISLAAVAADRLGAAPRAIAEAAREFVPSPHRRTEVAVWRGVRYVDDSKATNPHAALAAIEALAPVVLIAGGQAKGLDLTPLVTHPGVKRVVAIGEAAPALVETDPDTVVSAGDLEEAVRTAATLAVPGDTVLLAPGCASFDMFGSYAERGDAFAQAVSTMMEEEVNR